MIIKMNKDKSLQITKNETIFQGEYNASSIIFYIPTVINDINISQADIKIIIILPDETIMKKDLILSESEYENYLKYTMEIQEDITIYSGMIGIRLEIKDGEKFLVKSSDTKIFIDIPKSKRIPTPKCN